jgi:hypothetical protein
MSDADNGLTYRTLWQVQMSKFRSKRLNGFDLLFQRLTAKALLTSLGKKSVFCCRSGSADSQALPASISRLERY